MAVCYCLSHLMRVFCSSKVEGLSSSCFFKSVRSLLTQFSTSTITVDKGGARGSIYLHYLPPHRGHDVCKYWCMQCLAFSKHLHFSASKQ